MQINTIYRAKKVNSDEYVEGQLQVMPFNGGSFIFNFTEFDGRTPYYEESPLFQIDKSTLAIHFTNSNMEDADLRGADLSCADLSSAHDLKSAKLQGAKYSDDTKFPEGFDPGAFGLLNVDSDQLKARL